jgi:hypothetical protein
VKFDLQFLHRFYRVLLHLYPVAYRNEYGEELRTVFYLSIDEARKVGKFEIMRVVLRELVSLPQAILYEHVGERRKTKMTREYTSRFDFAPGSRKEILAAVAPFLLCGIVPILAGLLITGPDILEQVLGICRLVSMISILLVVFFKQVPRWFMPYLGLPLSILSILISIVWLDSWNNSSLLSFEMPMFLWTFLSYGYVWGMFVPTLVLLVLFSAAIPRYRLFYQRLRNDWTLLCFLLYGATPFMASLCFEGYPRTGPFMELIFLILAVGGWLYLRNDVPWKKFLILIGGQTLSLFTAAVGQVALYKYSAYYSPNIDTRINWWGTVHVSVAIWLGLVLVMFLPLVINLLPQFRTPLQAGEPAAG